MHWPIHIAASDAEGLGWLVVVVIWLIVQALSKQTKKKPTRFPPAIPRAPQAPTPKPVEENLRDFLKHLEGMGMELPPQAPPPPSFEILQEEPPPIRLQTKYRRDRRSQPQPATPPRVPVVAREEEQPVEQPIQPVAIPSSIRSHSLPTAHISLPRIQIPRMSFGKIVLSPMQIMHRPAQRPPLKDHRLFKQAMISRIILSQPKAFASEEEFYQQRPLA